MNKELYRTTIDSKIKEIKVSDDGIEIVTDNETISITTSHDQDCCESVYADYSSIKNQVSVPYFSEPIDLIIKGVEEMGFLFCLGKIKVFIPCYNYQNGYYSSNLELLINRGEVSTKIDISDLVEDHID